MKWVAKLLAGALVLSASCSSRVGFHPGTQCDLNTECGAPLVCRLGFCRLECRSQRDCGAGLTCVRDADGLGACQLPAEAECTLDSDCPAPLVCRDRSCTNACEDDRDCVPGSICAEDVSGALGCRDDGESDCALNSDCPAALICAVDHRCRVECRVSRDCAPELVCADFLDPPRCVSPDALIPDAATDTTLDSGTLDSGTLDTGTMDSGMLDSGTLDSGTLDSGVAGTGLAGTDLLVAGFAHSCGALAPNDLRCWGDNIKAQLGDGTSTARTTPVAVTTGGLPLSGVQRLTAGKGHSCAATSTGVYCWGDNTYGQIGTGSAAPQVASPARVMGAGDVIDLAAGREHVCALTPAGVTCWGHNDRGQLGDGTTMGRNVPTAVVGLPSVPVALAAGGTHTCALMAGGTVQCWGDNAQGQLGDGSTSGLPVPGPVVVSSLGGIERVVAGTGFTCALDGAGTVTCWGDGSFGTLGDGTFGARAAPGAPVSLPDPAAEIVGGVRHACALTTTNRVFCWGDNAASQLGRPAFTPLSSAAPLEIAGAGTPLEVSAGQSHSCVRLAAGFRCWGTNSLHQLGDGTTMASLTPVDVSWP